MRGRVPRVLITQIPVLVAGTQEKVRTSMPPAMGAMYDPVPVFDSQLHVFDVDKPSALAAHEFAMVFLSRRCGIRCGRWWVMFNLLFDNLLPSSWYFSRYLGDVGLHQLHGHAFFSGYIVFCVGLQ